MTHYGDLHHRRTVARVLAAAAVAALGVASAAVPAQAHYSGTGQIIARIEVHPYNYNSVWQPALDRGLANWNATASPAYISKYSNSGSSITAASYSNTWYGYYTRCGDFCYYIRMNARTISAAASNVGNFITSVLVHEYGHAFNCADLSSSSGVTSIMNEGRNRNSMVTPQPHDVSDVNAYYN